MGQGQRGIVIEFDEGSRSYYIVWEPTIVGLGRTRREALEELRQAAHFGTDATIDSMLDAERGR